MIVPGSIGDWVQASLLASLLGGAVAGFARALREEERPRRVRVRALDTGESVALSFEREAASPQGAGERSREPSLR